MSLPPSPPPWMHLGGACAGIFCMCKADTVIEMLIWLMILTLQFHIAIKGYVERTLDIRNPLPYKHLDEQPEASETVNEAQTSERPE